jgi:hypothetical protein
MHTLSIYLFELLLILGIYLFMCVYFYVELRIIVL